MKTPPKTRFCWPKMDQGLGQFGPAAGPFWARLCNPLNSLSYSIFQWERAKTPENPSVSMTWAMQPLLRQVCALYEPSGEYPTKPSSEQLVDRAGFSSAFAAEVAPERQSNGVTPRILSGKRFDLAVLVVAFGVICTPSCAADLWSKDSSFSKADKDSGWTRSSFASAEKTREVKETQAGSRQNPDFQPDPSATPIANLRDLISQAEAGHGGYDAVQHGASIMPDALPTEMTLDEIRAWVAATPGQPHAIGRYQVIPSTFERLARKSDANGSALFSPELQDRWANLLILEAGYGDFISGRFTPDAFMDNLAAVWAGLPLGSGLSAYDGIAGNKATISRAAYARALTAIFPAQSALASASR